eukprot:m.351405 g.351405  ORF g.351405 m.351405 type:complete len:66 (-) comp16240_c0_seq1:284-481(-)
MSKTKRRSSPPTKHDGRDHHSGARHDCKRKGAGSFNWGSVMDSMANPVAVDKGDPMYEEGEATLM